MQSNDENVSEEILEFIPRAAPIKHSMLRRNRDWHYCWPGVYMITLVLAERSQPLLGRLKGQGDGAFIELSDLGRAVAEQWMKISEFTPEIEPLDFVVMLDHFHGILRVKKTMKRPLGSAVGAFKTRCTQAFRNLIARDEVQVPANWGCTARGRPAKPVPACVQAGLWAPGFQDSIAFNEERLARQIAYIKDNPRRLAIKRANRDLFKVVQRVPFQGGFLSALGNLFLLDAPQFVQVQCSRSATAADIAALKKQVLDRAKAGAVVVSPCISPGEKEVARAAFEARVSLVVLKNMGFSPYSKPSGAYFDACAEGRLLMLAPIAWPYTTQKKPLTRLDACVMNRLAQLICKEDAATINYKGMKPTDIDSLVKTAITPPLT